MTANQIAWWNMQEQIRSHMQNELNTRNANSITESLGDEQNRISKAKVENDFILGTQGNMINRQQADTASRKATQDYDIGLRNVANQKQRNAQDYEIGTVSNANKAKEISNQYILGSVANQNQSIKNAQDFAINNKQQATNVRLADAALLSAGAQVGKLNPAGVVVALTAPLMQKGVNAGAKKVVETVKKATDPKNLVPSSPKAVLPIKGSTVIVLNKRRESNTAKSKDPAPTHKSRDRDPRVPKGGHRK